MSDDLTRRRKREDGGSKSFLGKILHLHYNGVCLGYICVLPLLLVQLPTFGHREHLIG